MRYKIFDNYQNYIMWITLTHSDMYMAQETFTNWNLNGQALGT